MASPLEVGLFIDFASIRSGLLRQYGQEPDPQLLMEKARKYGPVAVAQAYADFSDLPSVHGRKLEVAGIQAVDVPLRSSDAEATSAEMTMLMDIVDCLLDRPNLSTLVLMTGNPDFIRVTARARHRFGKQVVIAGVPGEVSEDLIESANLSDPLYDDHLSRSETNGHGGGSRSTATRATSAEPREAEIPDDIRLIQLILWLDSNRPYMTFGFIRSHALSPHHKLGFSEARVTDLLSSFKEQGILIENQLESDDGRMLRTLDLDEAHPTVEAVSALEAPHFEDNVPKRGEPVGS